MLNNDLANTPSPCVYVVWEELIATCTDKKRFDWFVKTRRPAKALATYRTQQLAVDAMWQTMMHGYYSLSVVTFLPAPLAALLKDRLDEEVVPCRDFLATTPTELVGRLPHMPWVVAVADPSLYRSRAFGSFGRYVPGDQPTVLGRLL